MTTESDTTGTGTGTAVTAIVDTATASPPTTEPRHRRRLVHLMFWVEMIIECVQIALAKKLHSRHRTWASKGPLIIQIPAFPITVLFRPILSMFLFSRNDTVPRRTVQMHHAFTLYILTSNLTVDIWGLCFRDWRFATTLPFVVICGGSFLLLELEVLYGARYRDAPSYTRYTSVNIGWDDIKAIRMHPWRTVYRKLHSLVYSQKFDPESGTYSSIWSPKNLFHRRTTHKKQETSTTQAETT